ncbi:PRELI-like family-domain-containing protein [Blastocladiella britannica]|nr:PRELI-like family-domain-containing protein [Blastocladiella britannica]
MKFYSHTTEFDAPWADVTCAIFNKYPNPFAAHVLQSDVLARSVSPTTGVLTSVRMHVKAGAVPSWGKSLFKSPPVSCILEDSTVDVRARRMVTTTRNMDHRRFLFVQETQVVEAHPTNPLITRVVTTARISSNLGWGLTGRLEMFGLSRFTDNVHKSRLGMLHVLGTLRERVKHHHRHPSGDAAAIGVPGATGF